MCKLMNNSAIQGRGGVLDFRIQGGGFDKGEGKFRGGGG